MSLQSWVPIPTWRAAAAAIAAAPLVVVVAPPWGFVAANLLLVGLMLADVALAAAPQHLRVERDLPAVVPLGAAAQVVWRVRNLERRPVRVALADDLAPSLMASTRRARLRVPGRATVAAAATLRPTRRGRFTPTALTLRVDGPLRLASRQATIALPGELRVYPPFRSREEAELRIERARILEVGLRSARGRGGGTEFESLREYGIDDEVRRIDWAATARAGKPIVREYRAERNQTILVLLDVGRLMAGRVPRDLDASGAAGPAGGWAEEAPRLDHAMDAIQALTTVATHLGDRVGLVAFGAEVRVVVPPRSGRAQLGRISEALYRLEPALEESDFAAAFTAAIARFRRRALLVVLSELAEEALSETLRPTLPRVTRDHLVVIGSVRDPQVQAWATQPPADAAGAYRQAAAVGALAGRRRVSASLSAVGAIVVDAPPRELPGRLTDAYLRVKATGRL